MSKNVLITGASRGLGYSLILQYLKIGYTVYACARNLENENLLHLKEEYNKNLYLIQMDIANSDSVKYAAEQVKNTCNKLDIIINNAGIHPEGSLNVLEDVDLDNALEVYNVNSVGALRVAKEFLALLEKGQNKILINISSEAGSIGSCPRSKEFHYCMSKAALNMGSQLLQNYFKERNIKVLALHPGWIRTDMGGKEADLDPLDVADSIIALSSQNYSMESPVFVDRNGKELAW